MFLQCYTDVVTQLMLIEVRINAALSLVYQIPRLGFEVAG